MIRYVLCLTAFLMCSSFVALGRTKQSGLTTFKNDTSVRHYFNGKLFMDTSVEVIKITPEFKKSLAKETRNKRKLRSINDTSYYKQIVYSDSSDVEWLSQLLYRAKEPRLPLDSTQLYFRFVWLRSLNEPVIITLHERNNKVMIETKYLKRPYVGSSYLTKLSSNKLIELESLVNSTGFWKLKFVQPSMPMNDGSTWWIEGQQGTRYHFVYRQYYHNNLDKLGRWLIENSDAKSQDVY